MRKPPDKAHGVACDNPVFALKPAASCRCIKRGKKLIGRIGFRARQTVKKRGLSGIGVAHKAHRHRFAFAAGFALRVTLLLQFFELIPELLHAVGKQTPVQLNLLFTGAAGLTEAASLALQVRPPAHKARGEVLKARQLHLQAPFLTFGAPAENFKNEFGSVHHRYAAGLRDVALLGGRERRIKDDDACFCCLREIFDLFDFAAS